MTAEGRVVVEIGTRGKLVVGEPFFEPGVPIVVDRKGLGGASSGDLALVRTGRGRAKVERVLGRADRIENVLEALLLERGEVGAHEPHALPEPTLEGRADLRDLPTFTIDPETAKDFDDAISVLPERRRPSRLGPHRRRVLLRRAGDAARPRRGRARVLRLRTRPRCADAPARARRRRLSVSVRTQDRLTVTVEVPFDAG